MHISTANILEIVTDRKNITIVIKYEVVYWLLIDIQLISTNFKGQGQGHGHFDSDFVENGEIYGKHYYCHQI